MSTASAIRNVVTSWPGISEQPGRFGAVEFMLGKREIGHLHVNVLLDVPFPRRVREELVEAGLAERHHILPESGWISFRIKRAGDEKAAVALLRRSYDLINAQLARRKTQALKAKARIAAGS